MQVHWRGVYPAINTQFKADESLDLDLFAKTLENQMDAGVHGMIVCGSLGEASTLEQAEKLQLTKTAMDVCGGKIPVILNVAERRTKDAIQLIKDGEKLGVDGFMALPPLLYKAGDQEVVDYFTTLAKSTSLPLMIYNNPVDYKTFVSVEMFKQLADCENITAVKESSRDLTNVIRMKNAFGDRFSVCGGVDTLALESFASGADGWVAGLVCAFPRETVAIWELCQQNRYDEARNIYKWFMPLLELDIHPKLVQNIKMAATAVGIGSEYVRAPRKILSGAERASVQKIIDTALANRPELPNLTKDGILR